jgi:hypothetical protein
MFCKILRARKFWSGVPFHAFFLCSLGVAYVFQKFKGAFGSATVVQVLERENSVLEFPSDGLAYAGSLRMGEFTSFEASRTHGLEEFARWHLAQ